MDLSADIVRRAQGGDPEAQVAFLQAVSGPVRSLLYRLGVPGEAEDALQEVYAKLLDVLPAFRIEGPAKPTTWAYTVIHRWLLERRRKRHLALVPLEAGMDVADGAPAADEGVARRQLRERLDRAISRLPEEQRRVLVMTQLHGYPLEAFAREEGLPLGTVKSRLHRARAELALSLGKALDGLEEGGAHATAG
jgi:RNA polymerase sigma-70 factor (ECF subfamily)